MTKTFTQKEIEAAFEKERKIKNAAYMYNIKSLCVNFIVAMIFAFAFGLGQGAYWYELFGWALVCIDFAATMICLTITPQGMYGGDLPLNLMKIATFLFGLVPWYFACATYMNFGWVKAIWMTPVTLIIFCAYGLFCLAKPVGMSSGDSLTITDLSQIKMNQKLAGLDPNKIPPTLLSVKQAKTMSITDWTALGYDLSLAGYDVFDSKKHRH